MPIPPDETAVLRRLVLLLMGPPGAPGGPAREEWPGELGEDGVRATFFLLDRAPGGDAEDFLTTEAPALLQQLSRRTTRRYVEHTGRLRGRVQWPMTYQARASGESDPACFVCCEAVHLHDTPENQL